MMEQLVMARGASRSIITDYKGSSGNSKIYVGVVGPEKGVYHIDQNAPPRVAADHPDVGIQREIRKNRKRTYTTSVGVDGAVLSSASG